MLLCICISCSNNTNSNIDKNKNLLNQPETLYKLAKINFDVQNFELARQQFKEINKLFPLSNEAIQSEIMIAFIDYIKMDYENAILNEYLNNKAKGDKMSLYNYLMSNRCSLLLEEIEEF